MIPSYSEGRGRVWRAARVPVEASIHGLGVLTSHWRRPPDFLLIGGRRCGTTTLYYALLQHPAVMPLVLSSGWLPMKEPRKGTRWLDRPRPGGPVYRAHFPSDLSRFRTYQRAGAALTGEATPWYLAAPGTAERAAREAPDARLIVVLRDPVLRTWSQFVEQRKRGHEPLDSFLDALDREDLRCKVGVVTPDGVQRSPEFASEHLSYRRQSEYADCLEPWFAHFSPEQILVLQSEELYADVVGTLKLTSTFLGLPPHEFVSEHRNQAANSPPDSEAATRLREHFRPYNARLEELVGRPFHWD